MRLTAEQRQQNETRIRAAMDKILRGDIPSGGKSDIKTLALQAGVDRTAFYGTRPYTHLREEFEARLEAMRATDDLPDPREAQVGRLKNEIATLKQRLIRHNDTIIELTDFRTEALSRLAAQHQEILQLRRQNDRESLVRRLPTRTTGTGPCG